MPFLTPDSLPTTFRCRRLRIPDDVQWLEIVNGVLSELLKERTFEAFGAITPADTAQVFQDMFFEYIKGEPCLIGAILPYATLTPPDGTLPCDGTTFNRADYPALYAALDPVYILDPDTFITPDLAGRAVIGAGEGLDLTVRSVGDAGGEETHILTEDELAAHAHTTADHTHTDSGHVHGYNYPVFNLDLEGAGVPDVFGAGNPPIPQLTTTGYAAISSTNVTVNSSGDDQPHNNMQPFHTLRYCIVSR